MRKFAIRLLIFIIPILIFLLIPLYFLFSSKECFFNIDHTILSNQKYLIGYAYSEHNYGYLKWKKMAYSERKEVIALGSSRVLQFRGRMFDTSFYNAGYTISGITEFEPYLRSIPTDKYPHYLIVGLDQWMFNASWDNCKTKTNENKWALSFNQTPNINLLKNVWSDLIERKYTFKPSGIDNTIRRIGLNSIYNNTGFRNDGSMFYGKQISNLLNKSPEASDYQYSNTFKRIKNGNQRFEFGEKVNRDALITLDQFLLFCKRNKMQVIAFIPPFADQVSERLSTSGNYKYLDSIHQLSLPIFKKYDFELYDFSKLSSCNSNDQETIDGFHGSEMTYLKMLITMLQSNSILKNVTNINRLQKDMLKPINRYEIYGP